MSLVQPLAGLAAALLLVSGAAVAAEPDPGRGALGRHGPARGVTFACDGSGPCRPQAAPGPADRAVHPFEGGLGRPCAYRWRATPEGTRKVRVCF